MSDPLIKFLIGCDEICKYVEDNLEMFKSYHELSYKIKRELGFPICHSPECVIFAGKTTIGEEEEIVGLEDCFDKGKAIADFHTHPTWVSLPSPPDIISDLATDRSFTCVSGKGSIDCFMILDTPEVRGIKTTLDGLVEKEEEIESRMKEVMPKYVEEPDRYDKELAGVMSDLVLLVEARDELYEKVSKIWPLFHCCGFKLPQLKIHEED